MNQTIPLNSSPVFHIYKIHQCPRQEISSRVFEHYISKTFTNCQGEQQRYHCKHCALVADTKQAIFDHKYHYHKNVVDDLYEKIKSLESRQMELVNEMELKTSQVE